MGKNTSVSLGDYFDGFVKNKVSEGRFKNASEVIRAGLRLLEDDENRSAILRASIQEGLDSGRATAFDHREHLETLKSQRKNG